MTSSSNCPVDLMLINENRTRIVALMVGLLTISFLLTLNIFIPTFLMIDFYLRAFCAGKYSLLQYISEKVELKGWIGIKNVDAASKRFAAQVGFLISDFIFIAAIISLNNIAYCLAAVFCLFSFLESFLGFCTGCYIFKIYNKIFNSSKSIH